MPAKIRLAAVLATLVGLAVTVILVLAGVVALSGAEAASNVSCGDTITTDATLHHNLLDCPNNGIIIGADNVTLDLNYHTIDGDGAPAVGCNPETEFCDFGVLNNGQDGVTVTNGSVREFALGVSVFGARDNRVLNISSSRQVFFGMVVVDSTRSVIQNGSFSGNMAPEGDGIGVFGSDHLQILHNKIRRNPGPGIHVGDSTETLIKRNLFSRNGPGILIEASRNEIRRNRLMRGAGVVVNPPGNRNVIARNRVARAVDSIAVEKGRGNVVAHNVVGRPRGAGIRLGIQRRPSIGGAHNLVRGNLVKGSSEDGFLINEKDDHSLLKYNTAKGARDDGLDVQSRTAKLIGNRAVRNRDLGIAAVRGVIDGGQNKANGNGDPRQCTHIACN